jgi:hypothetical protein
MRRSRKNRTPEYLARILKTTTKAYAPINGGLTYEEALLHKSGDSLFEFIVIELTEVLRDELCTKLQEACDIGVRTLNNAINDLTLTRDAIAELPVPKGAKKGDA